MYAEQKINELVNIISYSENKETVVNTERNGLYIFSIRSLTVLIHI